MPDHTPWLNASTDSAEDDLYFELKRIASGRMAIERQGGTLDATALVHEAWLHLE